MVERIQENIENQMGEVKQISNIDVPVAAGLEMLEDRIRLMKLTKKFMDSIVVHGKLEISIGISCENKINVRVQ